jgi:hypothetical protein
VSQKARNWAAAAASIALLAGGALAYGQISGTFAIFTAETENPNSVFKGSWIPAPSGTTSSLLNATPWSQEHLVWTSGNSTAMPGGATNPVTGQTILYADGGSGASASCGTYSSFSTTTAAATTSDVTGTNLADWWCFEVQSTSASASTSGAWTSDVVTFTPRQILVPVSVVMTNGRTAGTPDTGDTIVITFNQNINTPTANRFCLVHNGTSDVVFIGDTKASGSACASTDTYTIGKITGVTASGTINALNESVSVSGKVLTVTISANGNKTASFSSPVFLASSSVTAVTGSQPACVSTASPTCTVSPTGGL